MTLLLLSTTIDERYATARIACFITATNLDRLWILGESLLFMRYAVQEKVKRRYWFIISKCFLAFLATAVFSVVFGTGALSQEEFTSVWTRFSIILLMHANIISRSSRWYLRSVS
jgi:hypothetical protein